MRRSNIYIIIIILLLIAGLFAYQYIFNIYEVNFKIEPQTLYADGQSTLKIEVIPVNAFGWKAPLRNIGASFDISEGGDLVDIIEKDEKNGILKIRAKNITGKVVIFVKPELALLPSNFTIEIFPNTT